MLVTLLFCVVCVALFLWVMRPLFGPSEPLREPDLQKEAEENIVASLREFQADVDLGKVEREDLRQIESDLRSIPDGEKR
ncbi:MAG: hypothetical protein JHC34_00985 [Acidobacteria bacterium]|jgi:hypothetical protein|nr:hypothetical protein [Acidobacteriota bacterium]